MAESVNTHEGLVAINAHFDAQQQNNFSLLSVKFVDSLGLQNTLLM